MLKAPERYQVLSGPVPVSFSLFNNLSQVQREVVAVLVDLVPPQEGADTEYQDEEVQFWIIIRLHIHLYIQ